jgi:hypothetical protein
MESLARGDSCALPRTTRRCSGAPEIGVFKAEHADYFPVI